MKSLSPEELEGFGDYLLSPIFNRDKRCVDLYKLVKKDAPAYASSRLDKTRIFAKLFPNNPTYNSSLRALMTKLTQLLEGYLVHLKMYGKEQQAMRNYLLLQTLRERNQRKYYLQWHKQFDEDFAETVVRGTEHHQARYMIAEDKNIFDYLRGIKPDRYEHLDFDTFVVLKKLGFFLFVFALKQGENAANYISFENISEIIERERLDKVPAVKLYHTTIKMQTQPDKEDNFKALKQILKAGVDYFPSSELGNIYTIAINYCSLRIIAGKTEYQTDMLDLYMYMIRERLVYVGEYVYEQHIKNIVSLGCKLKRFDWTENFITEYRDKVALEMRETVYHFNMGALHFYREDYDKAMLNFMQVRYATPAYEINGRSMLLKCYYAMEETEPLLSLADAFKKFLRSNKKVPAHHRRAYLNFIKYTVRLYRIKAMYGKKSLADLKTEIAASNSISDKQWLLEMVAELE